MGVLRPPNSHDRRRPSLSRDTTVVHYADPKLRHRHHHHVRKAAKEGRTTWEAVKVTCLGCLKAMKRARERAAARTLAQQRAPLEAQQQAQVREAEISSLAAVLERALGTPALRWAAAEEAVDRQGVRSRPDTLVRLAARFALDRVLKDDPGTPAGSFTPPNDPA